MITGRRLRVPLWAWPTVLSFDAPLVAVGWLLAFGHELGLSIGHLQALILGLSVWLVYTADRVLDSFRLTGIAPPTLRHAFAALRRRALLVIWLGVLGLDLALAVTVLNATTLRGGLLLTGAAGLYFIQLQLGAGVRWKPLQVGLLFAAGIALFLWPQVTPPTALPPLLLFAGVCALNCGYLARWERRLDDGTGSAAQAPSWQLPVATWTLFTLALAASLASGSRLYGALALAVLALRCLHAARGRLLGLSVLRSLADAALLVPLLLI